MLPATWMPRVPLLCGYRHNNAIPWILAGGFAAMTLPASAAPALDLRAAAGGGTLLFRQLFDADTGTFTYLLADGGTGEGC